LNNAPQEKTRIAVLVSGSGTNLQALIDAEALGTLAGDEGGRRGTIAVVIADKPEAYALKRAAKAVIPTAIVQPERSLPLQERRNDLSRRILELCQAAEIDLIVLAGFLSILQGDILQAYEGRIINLHPALLPKYGGPGMYGAQVHQAVLATGETESGCSVHYVTAGVDAGPLILQRKVPVLPDDTPDTLAERIHVEEHIAIVEAVQAVLRT
jgi:phosphoribosylglycinamide formyltransferase-1